MYTTVHLHIVKMQRAEVCTLWKCNQQRNIEHWVPEPCYHCLCCSIHTGTSTTDIMYTLSMLREPLKSPLKSWQRFLKFSQYYSNAIWHYYSSISGLGCQNLFSLLDAIAVGAVKTFDHIKEGGLSRVATKRGITAYNLQSSHITLWSE